MSSCSPRHAPPRLLVTGAVMSVVLVVAAIPELAMPVLYTITGVSLVTTFLWLARHQRAVVGALSGFAAATFVRVSRYHLGTLMIVVAVSGLVLSLAQFVESDPEPKRHHYLRLAAQYTESEARARREASDYDRLAAAATHPRDADYYRSQADELRVDAEVQRSLSQRSLRAAERYLNPPSPLSPQSRAVVQVPLPTDLETP